MSKPTSLSGSFCVHLVRHAHAGNAANWDGDDAQRPLTKKGRSQAERLGRFMVRHGMKPDLLVTSPLVRAKETSDVLSEHLALDAVVDDRLAEDFTLVEVAQILLESGAREPVFVGHNPDMSELLAHIISNEAMPFKKGALATVDLHAEEAGGTLRWLIPPSLLEAAKGRK